MNGNGAMDGIPSLLAGFVSLINHTILANFSIRNIPITPEKNHPYHPFLPYTALVAYPKKLFFIKPTVLPIFLL